MTQENKLSNNQQRDNLRSYQPPYQDDEIDLRELFQVIWDYKWLTAIMCSLAIAGSIFYALTAQEWWVAKGKVLQPQLNDVASLYSQSKQVGAILNAINSSSSSSASNSNSVNQKKNSNEMQEFVSLFEPETLFTIFINSFNSSINKKVFLESNAIFVDYLASHNVVLPTAELNAENQLVRATYRRVLNRWMEEISASFNAKTGELALSFRAPEKDASAQLLNEYIVFVSNKVKANQFEKVLLFVDSAKQELAVSIDISKQRVEQELTRMLKKTEYAYQIASKASLVDYKPSLNLEEELFQINLGEKALKAKIDVLKSINDFSLLDPTISEKQITLDMLNQLKFVDDRSFTPFRYLEVVEPPMARATPKRALIVILSTLLAGMLSIFIALVHYFMTKKESE